MAAHQQVGEFEIINSGLFNQWTGQPTKVGGNVDVLGGDVLARLRQLAGHDGHPDG